MYFQQVYWYSDTDSKSVVYKYGLFVYKYGLFFEI